MIQGAIVNLVRDKGFGFIRCSKGGQYFFHKSMLSEGAAWEELAIGQAVEFTPSQGKKGMEAQDVRKVIPAGPLKSIDDLPGDYGLMSIFRGTYTNLEKNMDGCDGIAFCGLGTFGGRFPNNPRLISRLRDMRAVFDREQKFWFLRAEQVPANMDRIDDLVAVSKREHRQQIIAKSAAGVLGAVVAVTFGAIIIAGALLAGAALLFGGHRGGNLFRAKVSRTGNVWISGNRIT